MRYSMIMAGGSGTRLWPLSRRATPKQLLRLFEGRSLLALTAGRLEGLVDPGRQLVCAAERYRAMIFEAVPGLRDERFLGEPEGRDTVNAVGLTAAVLAREDPAAVFAVLTADHLIEPEAELRRGLRAAFELVEASPRRFVTFSVPPDRPATSFGYVQHGDPVESHAGVWRVASFREKPTEEQARAYLAAGDYAWNSGMFVYHAATFLDALRRWQPASHAGLMRIAEAWGTPARAEVLEAVYPALPAISVDYAIMEPAAEADDLALCTVALDVRWRDVGSWPALARELPADADGHRGTARALHLGSHDVLAMSDDPGHTITTIGCRDLVVIHTADATLVCPMSEAERVKELAGLVDEELR